MNRSMMMAASAAMCLYASSVSAQTVNNTDLPNVTGSFGAGVATTTTDATGTVTTVTGPGGGANRASAAPTLGSWYQTNVGGGGSVGITTTYSNDGDGAAYFATTSGDSKGDLQFNFAAPVALSSLQSVSFDFFVDPSTNTTNGVFSPVLRFNMTKNGAFAGSLVFEYLYQNQTAAPEGQWISQSATLGSGIWWATNAALGPTFADANGGQKSLADWLAANSGATLAVTGVQIGVGSGWNGNFAGAVDNVAFNFGNTSADFNFAVAAVPEPATWAMMIGGFGFIGGALRARRRSVAFA
jgi:hypothetical protein